MSEEEIIKTLQEIIQKNQQVIKEAYKNKDINTIQLVADIDNEALAIEGILDLYNKEKEKNKYYEEELKATIEQSVPKYKIREKIKEYSKERYIAGEHLVVQVLQELLEE